MSSHQKEYSFSIQKNIGLAGEKVLDSYFARWYRIATVSQEQDRAGVDRIFYPKDGKPPRKVQYKTDTKDTGYAFVETVSVFRDGHKPIPGWAYTLCADWLLYYFSAYKFCCCISALDFSKVLPEWEARKENKFSKNRDYHSCGLLVPIGELIAVSHQIFKIE